MILMNINFSFTHISNSFCYVCLKGILSSSMKHDICQIVHQRVIRHSNALPANFKAQLSLRVSRSAHIQFQLPASS
jgi:hypothetical protein